MAIKFKTKQHKQMHVDYMATRSKLRNLERRLVEYTAEYEKTQQRAEELRKALNYAAINGDISK